MGMTTSQGEKVLVCLSHFYSLDESSTIGLHAHLYNLLNQKHKSFYSQLSWFRYLNSLNLEMKSFIIKHNFYLGDLLSMMNYRSCNLSYAFYVGLNIMDRFEYQQLNANVRKLITSDICLKYISNGWIKPRDFRYIRDSRLIIQLKKFELNFKQKIFTSSYYCRIQPETFDLISSNNRLFLKKDIHLKDIYHLNHEMLTLIINNIGIFRNTNTKIHNFIRIPATRLRILVKHPKIFDIFTIREIIRGGDDVLISAIENKLYQKEWFDSELYIKLPGFIALTYTSSHYKLLQENKCTLKGLYNLGPNIPVKLLNKIEMLYDDIITENQLLGVNEEARQLLISSRGISALNLSVVDFSESSETIIDKIKYRWYYYFKKKMNQALYRYYPSAPIGVAYE